MSPERIDGYAPLRDYAAIGDGRTIALVARDGAVDWLCLPDLDSPSVFGSLLDARRGGRFTLAPDEPFQAEHRYLESSNVLETTFTTADGVVRVTDALTVPDGRLAPQREVVRRVDGLAGRVPVTWRVEPRFAYGTASVELGRRIGVPVATRGTDALAMQSWDAGEPVVQNDGVGGRFEAVQGTSSLLALSSSRAEPLVLSTRDDVEMRLASTDEFWRAWTAERSYDGPWRDAVLRSALALKLLCFAPSGAVAAAPTTSLPEQIGAGRNWDYRYCWIRDSAFTVDALLRLGCPAEARAYFSWLLHATQITHPRLEVLYGLDGGTHADERTLPLEGYRGSRPVRTGNAALGQLQLDIYGDLMQAAWVYSERTGLLDAESGKRLADMADLVCEIWRQPDAGIWEVRDRRSHFTQSKMMCWLALDRALRLVESGVMRGRKDARWRREADAIRTFVEDRCWSDTHGSFMRCPDVDELDASLLLAFVSGYADPSDPRVLGTIDAIRRHLGRGPLTYRYTGENGAEPDEGAFLTCSFWLVHALALAGRVDEASAVMDELLGLANDVGLYAEECDPDTGAFLGNMPQALVHLSLIEAAAAIGEADR